MSSGEPRAQKQWRAIGGISGAIPARNGRGRLVNSLHASGFSICVVDFDHDCAESRFTSPTFWVQALFLSFASPSPAHFSEIVPSTLLSSGS